MMALTGGAVREAVREGIEEAAATIAGPFVPLLSELPALVGVVGGQVVEHLTPLRRAALIYELRDLDGRIQEWEAKQAGAPTASGRSSKLPQRVAPTAEEVAERLGVMRARKMAIEHELWPEPFG